MPDSRSEQRGATAALASLCLIWSYNIVLMKTGLEDSGIGLYDAVLGADFRRAGAARKSVAVAGAGSDHCAGRPDDSDSAVAVFTGELLASALAVCAGMSWGASVIYVKNLQKKTSISMLMITLWQMIIGSVALAVGWTMFEPRPIRWTGSFIASVLYSAIPATGLAWILFYYALKRMPAGLAGLGTLATPVIGALAAWLQMGERPTPVEASGMALIGVALAMLAWNLLDPARSG